MKLECKDLDYALREGSPELMEALAAHAEACPSCREDYGRWNEMSGAARALHKHWDSPNLWPRIHQALAEESQRTPQGARWAPRGILQFLSENWQAAAAGAAVVLLTVSVAWVFMRNSQPPVAQKLRTDQDAEKRLLTEKALHDIETNEAAYVQSIEKLSKLVEPKIEKSASPLLVSYREKLMLIDAAIVECRANIERNRFNAHLRRELISVYQEKQRTLEDVVRINKNDLQ